MEKKQGRGWRVLLTEFGIIVLGVGVALAAQQAAEWWNWRGQVAQAREIIATEMAVNLRLAMWRMRTQQCTERRLDELAAILDTASRTGKLPPVGAISTPPRGYWPSGAWESVVASQAAAHFPRQELADLTMTYKMLQKLEEFSIPEIADWNALYAMVGPGRRLDPASEARLRDALSQARARNRIMAVMSVQAAQRAKGLNLPFSAADQDVIAQGERLPVGVSEDKISLTLIGAGSFGAICAPLPAAPATYGQALWDFVPARMDEAVKTLSGSADSRGAR